MLQKIKVCTLVSVLTIANVCFAESNIESSYSYDYAALSGRCQVYDPYESFNRKIFIFNGVLDTFILRPIAKVYGKTTNDYTKSRVSSFASNLSEPLTTVNFIIQGNPEGALKSFWRFAINSTIGIGGLFDVAAKADLKVKPQTFGNTLGHYGVGSGPYVVLPILGGTSARNVTDKVATNSILNPINYKLHHSFQSYANVASAVHSRDAIMPFTDYVTKNSADPYIAIRDAIIQQQEGTMDYPEGYKCPKVRTN